MQWFALGSFLLYVTGCVDAGALKCVFGTQDSSCSTEKREISPVQDTRSEAECQAGSNCLQRDKRELEPCVPGSSFKIDCNTCHCNQAGQAACTKRGCIKDFKRAVQKRDISNTNTTLRRSRAAPEAAKACQPGQEFRMDCNKCLCNDEGQDFSCTRIDCAALNNNGGGSDSFVGTRTKREAKTQEIELDCVPGSVFDRDCNVCRCTTDGHHATCTQRRCSRQTDKDASTTTESNPSFRCTPGDQFKRDCNDCTCSADGKNVFCTLRLCDQDIALADI